MGVRLYVEDQCGVCSAVETETEDDFMYFRDSVHMALEGGVFGERFPVFMNKFFSDWEAGEVPALERELTEILAAFRKLPPKPPDGNWRSKLIRSGRKPTSLAEVYVDNGGSPLIEKLIGLAQTALEDRLPIKWGD